MLSERRGRIGIGADSGPAGAVDAGFLVTDSFAIAAEVVHVIQVDAYDHCAIGVEGVYGIEPSAEPHLEHGRLYPLLHEQPERGEGAELEIGQRHGLRSIIASTRIPRVGRDSASGVASP